MTQFNTIILKSKIRHPPTESPIIKSIFRLTKLLNCCILSPFIFYIYDIRIKNEMGN